MPGKNFKRILIGTGLILLIPLLAMQFSGEVRWGPLDFIVIATLLTGTGLAYEFLKNKLETTMHRVVLAIVLTGLLLLAWAELAVGVFGTPFAGS